MQEGRGWVHGNEGEIMEIVIAVLLYFLIGVQFATGFRDSWESGFAVAFAICFWPFSVIRTFFT